MNNSLNEIGLTHTVRELMNAGLASTGLHAKMKSAQEAWEKNQAFIDACKRKLGAHTKEVNKPEIVLVDEIAAFVPIPATGYEDTKVEVLFTYPKGTLNLANEKALPTRWSERTDMKSKSKKNVVTTMGAK